MSILPIRGEADLDRTLAEVERYFINEPMRGTRMQTGSMFFAPSSSIMKRSTTRSGYLTPSIRSGSEWKPKA